MDSRRRLALVSQQFDGERLWLPAYEWEMKTAPACNQKECLMRPHSQNSGLLDSIRSTRHSFIALFSAVVVLHFGAVALQAQDDVSDLVQRARSGFKPVSDKELAEARTELRERMNEVAEHVNPSNENGKRWLRYLRFEALKQAVAEDRPKNLAPLDSTLSQLNRNETGLENRQFRRLAIALRRYHDLAAVSSWDKPDEIYGKQLDALQRDLEAYRKDPSPRTQMALSERIRIIDGIGQAPKLVAALRSDLAKPNAFVDISTSLISASAGPINRDEPVTDCILGTNVHSDAHTTGETDAVTIPSEKKAIVEFHSKGHVWSNNTGFNGPAVIRSTSDTDFTAKKRVELSDASFTTASAQADADTCIHLHSVSKQGGGLGSRLVSSIGWSKAQGSRGQAESISGEHAETRIANKFNDELDDEVQKARTRYEDEYRRPLERRGEVPEYIRFSSNKDSINFEATQASHSQLGASGNPPAAPEKHDVTMRLHETAVDNYSASVLSGATARETKADEDVKFDVHLPKWMDKLWKNRKTEATDKAAGKEEPFKEYALTFRDDRPISVNFIQNKVKLTVHISHLKSGEKSFDNWDVTSTYNPELSEGKVILRREGDLDMLPADFRGQLDSRQVAERSNLKEELNRRSDQGKGFPKTIEFDPIKPEGKVADAGPLEFNQFTCGDGWVIIGLDRQKKQARTASKASLRE
jgi:hypothetical protein